MSKRFIDTGIFDDDWFMDLSKDAKLLWIYFITKCDHAGLIKINPKLCTLQTDIKDIDKFIKELGKRLVTVSDRLYFIPKFIEFQYPGFPNSKVRQQQSAVEILKKHNLFNEGILTVTELLPNSYDNGNGSVPVIDNGLVNEINYDAIIKLYHDLCPKMNKVQVVNDQRKGFINARYAEFGMEKVTEVLRRAGESDFLNGINDKGWKADFEWLMRPTNFVKVLEGKYNNQQYANNSGTDRRSVKRTNNLWN